MTTLFRVVLVASALGVADLARAADSATPFRPLSLEAALPVAAKEGKIVVIDFFTTWCEPCKRLDAETWADAGVQRLLEKSAVALKLDAEKEGRAAAARYEVKAYPTILLLKPDGTVLDRIVGFLEPARFTTAYQLGLEGKTARVRAESLVQSTSGTLDAAAVQARFDLARTLAREGDKAGALREILWCFDEGMVKEPSFGGVRASFLISEWGRLAKTYAPAREVMEQRCADAEKRLRGGHAERTTGTDFAALCMALGDETRLMSVYEALPAGRPDRQSLGFRVYRLMLERQRYAEALSAQPYAVMVRIIDVTTQPLPDPDAPGADARRRGRLSTLLDYVEVLTGAGDTAHADELVARLRAFDPSEATASAIEERRKRALAVRAKLI